MNQCQYQFHTSDALPFFGSRRNDPVRIRSASADEHDSVNLSALLMNPDWCAVPADRCLSQRRYQLTVGGGGGSL